jgi:hypothetical protein
MRELYKLAEQQYGVVSRAQALAAGLSESQVERRIRMGHLCRVFPAIYRVGGSPVTVRQRPFAACLWLGDNADVSHLTGAALLHLDGCRTRELFA